MDGRSLHSPPLMLKFIQSVVKKKKKILIQSSVRHLRHRRTATASKDIMEKTIVLYPGLFVSHFVPMMQLADVFLEEGYAVAVALIDLTLDQDVALAAAVDRVASDKPSVAFHRLPRIQNPPTVADYAEALLWYFEIVKRYNDQLRGFLCSVLQPPRSVVHAVIVDAPSVAALDVTKELGIPAYTFFAANASAVAVFLQLPWIRAEGQPSFKELRDAPVTFSGVPPIPASYLMRETLQEPESEIYKAMMNAMRRNAEEPDGILVNTFASLEARAVGALRDPPSIPPGSGRARRTPPVYCVGPLVAAGAGAEAKEKHECLAWLDRQPERSVVFLCFGSTAAATHSEEQLREVAVGLQNSGHRFLWVVRAPLRGDTERLFDPRADADLDVLLPDGFLEGTRDRGLVVKHWAPQVEVLSHRATGAFVTHCGWNSALEGITAGVPMLCWPMYAEQKMNKLFMVEEAMVGVEMVGWQQGLVRAEEVEAKVRLVMESEEGDKIRARVVAHRDAATVALRAGGSSRAAYGQFLTDAAKLGARE
ncbi:anthocyanidin 5,3-O-glucosyltransferase-like [Miscanthus floridulus]|uniref:anthocyanidin 5,3-O-glucosyltransferase-like n=1 Tax=Miscanthus floridulus TaxID=154761 RepID=UPI003457D2A2